jgi:hypothetical protein
LGLFDGVFQNGWLLKDGLLQGRAHLIQSGSGGHHARMLFFVALT